MGVDGKSRSQSAIMYQDTGQNVFLIDIPTSINLAQHIPGSEEVSHIFSGDPIRAPYPGPSPEPKTAAARAKVLETIPIEEQEYHSSVVPIVVDSLQHLKKNYNGEWCLPRCKMADCLDGEESGETGETRGRMAHVRKRKRTSKDSGLSSSMFGIKEPVLSVDGDSQEASNIHSFTDTSHPPPPLILSPGTNQFPSMAAIQEVVVKNPSSAVAKIRLKSKTKISNEDDDTLTQEPIFLTVPPGSIFILSRLSSPSPQTNTISSVSPAPRFDLIIADPPWPNRSVQRSAHYSTLLSFGDLKSLIISIINSSLQKDGGIVGIWTTNSKKSRDAVCDAFRATGLRVFEEWIWVKMTLSGKPVSPASGLWRKPYEVLMLGKSDKSCRRRRKGAQPLDIRRRVIAAVPDIHSRKPNLKELVEWNLFTLDSTVDRGEVTAEGQRSGLRKYSALELFARNLTAGWWSSGDEVLRFNWEGWWATQEDI